MDMTINQFSVVDIGKTGGTPHQAITAAAGATTITFSQKNYDSLGEFDKTTNMITLKYAGLYRISYLVNAGSVYATAVIEVDLVINGSNRIVQVCALTNTALAFPIGSTRVFSLSGGDQISLKATVTVATDAYVINYDNYTFLSLERIA